ncbi:MAG: hypothetical protein KDI67_07670 [Gammaproteobacteria bacterium]|nr:hypothetical protein [Gammaproteobacteria bacterium]
MRALIEYFIRLAFLKRGPQDLPSSPELFALLAVLSVLVGTANGTALFGSARAALGANLLDLGLTLVMLLVLLQFRGHAARWLQTATAFLGLGVLAGCLMLLVRAPATSLGITELAMLVDFVLAIWLHVALGGVLRHALGIPLLAGVVIVLSYTIMAFNLIARIFPPAIGT